LWSTDRETVGVIVFFLYHEGYARAAAAVATVALAITLPLAIVAIRLARDMAAAMETWRT
jgi:hypothetical protein